LSHLPLTAPCAVALTLLATAGSPQAQADEAVRLRSDRALGAAVRTPGAMVGGKDGPGIGRAERVYGEFDEWLRLNGRAELRTRDGVVRGDTIDYRVVTDEVQVHGNARLYQDGVAFWGPALSLRLDALTGAMPDAAFSYSQRGLRGESRLVEFLEDRVRMNDATITACRPGDDAWWVRADTLDIDRVDELAVAHSARLYFQGVPVLASPYFQIPLGDRRRSGLLTPGFNINNKLGPEVTAPFYWNIAPNRDYTLTPRIMARRGVLAGNEFRFLEPRVRGTMVFDVISNDRVAGRGRSYTNLSSEYASTVGIGAGLNWNRVSDDNFFVDFSRTIVGASPAVLPQEAYLSYGQADWTGALRVTKNQALLSLLNNDITQKPYERVPQLTVTGTRTDWKGFDVSLLTDVTRFDHPTLEPGTRAVFNPSVSYPWLTPGWFVVPKLQWHTTLYQLDEQLHPGAASLSRNLPIASLDSGLVFERDTHLLGQPVTQTLEPRLFYAFIPYRATQNDLPNFDSALSDFNFAQLFTENVFSGSDRIGEANQVTTAVVSRIVDPASGAERLRAALGQRFYFSAQRVVLPGGTPRVDRASDVLAELSGRIADRWIGNFSVDYSTAQKQVVQSAAGIRWAPRPSATLAVSYRYQTGVLEQLDVAAQWPITRRWYGVGRINYSLDERRWIEALAGFEYKADCWVGRIVAQSFATTALSRTTTLFFQIELNGLASVGTSPVEQLRRTIPGYQKINPPPAEPGRFSDYE